MSNIPPESCDDFQIALICALPVEATAAERVFSKIWTAQDKVYEVASTDANTYTWGRIDAHNVVLAHMSGPGKITASRVASNLQKTFTSIKLAVVLGVCGGAPRTKSGENIFLGDLIISTQVIQYDFGRQYPSRFLQKNLYSNLQRAPESIRTKLAMMQTSQFKPRFMKTFPGHLKTLLSSTPDVTYPGQDKDILLDKTYIHKHHDVPGLLPCECLADPEAICENAMLADCDSLHCDKQQRFERKRERSQQKEQGAAFEMPSLHLGRYGSADAVMRSGAHRDQLVEDHDIIGFEQEGAGVWDIFPCFVLKAVADYCDSHKDKVWQEYAAHVAAAGLRSFLEHWQPTAKKSPAPKPQAAATPSGQVTFGGFRFARNMTEVGQFQGTINYN